ncbi:MAG: hypothetical protein IJW21_01010 [Clostridia bacterium]|nr:hypothetical protein [Clostridia bacterium]
MALKPNFREEYVKLLKEFVLTIKKSNRYEAVCEKYNELKKEIEQALAEMNSVCSEAELLIDKATCAPKAGVPAMIGDDEALNGMVQEFGALCAEKEEFAAIGWDDDLMNHISNVLAIAAYENMEKEIIAEFGRDKGQKIIYEEKKKGAELEKELGGKILIDSVERMEALFRKKHLFPAAGDIDTSKEDNLDEGHLTIVNDMGEPLRFEVWSQLHYKGELYIELELMEEMKTPKMNYYKVLSPAELLLVEDEDAIKELDKARDALEVAIQRKKLGYDS